MRLNIDGSLDTTFGSGGVAVVATSGGYNSWRAAIQPDGKIVTAGFGKTSGKNLSILLMRVNADGRASIPLSGRKA